MSRRSISAVAALVAIASGLSRWPRLTTWGATVAEVAASMPGDEIVVRARYRSTHAVTVAAPAEDVWPWLVQLGQGRGGLYSYDWLENLLGLDIHSARRIDPDLQTLAVGDQVRLVPEGTEPPLRFTVVRLEPPILLVLGPGTTRVEALDAGLPYPCWTFRLTTEHPGSCRLVVRFQADFAPSLVNRLAYAVALAPVQFVMERRMLLGIKQRAES